MTDITTGQLDSLQSWLAGLGQATVAVSGGVDSLTLALVAGRTLGHRASMVHALSPAVPPAATRRVKEVAGLEGWALRLVQTGEFDDEAYLANPYRRCFHCKDRLYATLAGHLTGSVLSGTNLDDMQDFRPGLQAAELHGVRHPFVECAIDKAAIRSICRRLGFPHIAQLPASPCLSSRVETGVRIEAPVLGFIDRVEELLRGELQPAAVRCRIQRQRIAVQLDAPSLASLDPQDTARWGALIRDLARPLGLPGEICFEPYRMGSAFVDVA